jgi:predicted CoA-binding protein
MYNLHFLTLFCIIFSACKGYKILAVFPVPVHSHYTIASKIVNELAHRGHEVTFVTPYLQKSAIKNLKEISVESVIDIVNERKEHLYSLEDQTIFKTITFLSHLGYIVVEKTFQNENVQKLLHSEEHYDLVILPQFINEALIGIAHHFKAPFVLVTSMPLFPWSSFLLAHPAPSSYVPNLLTRYTGHMNFWQRLTNSFYDTYSILYYKWVMLPKHRELVRKYIPGEPDLYTFLTNGSLLLINCHVSSYEPIPQVPNAIEIGGLHIDEPRKLPDDLQKFLDDSVDGVVLFSMGSNLKSSALPQIKRDAILKAFSKLKQNVLWKWETDELPGQPKNVKLMKWLPQSDVLAHPNIKAFITHGGLFSTMESIYRGIPVIGIPVFADQKMNMATAVSHGYAELVPLQALTEENLSSALNQILNNPRYKSNVMKRSSIMRDRPVKPMDLAIYWIEYVVRHQGAPHLRYPGMDLAWHQRNLLDVIAFAIISGITLLSVVFFIIKSILKRVYTRPDKNKKNN